MAIDPHSQRQLGLAAAIAVVTGESIALGIFLTPAAMAKSLGSPLLLGLVWLGMALMAVCGALCYSELAIRYPESGGEYVYLRTGYGEQVAFLYGWMSAIVLYPGVAAALAVGAAPYVAQVLPGALPMRGLAIAVTPAALLCGFGAIHLPGTRLGGAVMSAVNGLKLTLLFALVAWAAVSGHAHWSNLLPLAERRPGSEAMFPAIAGAAVSAFFSFGGWWEAGKIAGEVRNPRKNLPLAFLGGVCLVTAVYLAFSAAFLSVVPLEKMSSNTAFVAQFGEVLFGSIGARVLAICVLVCVCGGIAALSMAAPRVCSAMAQAGAFFPAFGRLHPRSGAPANAILLQTALSLAALSLGAFDKVLSYIVFSAVVFLAITASTLFRTFSRVRAWWFPLAPMLFIGLSGIIALLILMHDPWPALAGVALVLCGIPLRRAFATGRGAAPLVTERNG